MGEVEENGTGTDKREVFTRDGTVDLKGRPFVRSKGGRWTACSFIVVYELFERMGYYGIASNMVIYLTKKLHQGTVTSSNTVTNWIGTIWMTPILGAYIADAFLGRYWTFVISSAIYLSGMCLLTLTVTLPSLRPPSCSPAQGNDCKARATPFQLGIFYCALYIIAVGAGGTKPNISTMGADQFDDLEPKERAQKLSFFNWWMFTIFLGTLCTNVFLVYIQENVGYTLGYGLPTVGLAIAVMVFLVGTPFYRHKVVSGSPLTRIAEVLVAATRNWRVPLPHDPKQLHELCLEEYAKNRKSRIDHTPSLRLLDKAAVKTGKESTWRLCPVTQVEETKQMIKMLPVLLVALVPTMLSVQVNTLFVKQGSTLDRSIGPHFKIPEASLLSFITIFMLISLVAYDWFLVPALKRRTKNPRGMTLLQRMGTGIVMETLVMIIASLIEMKRLSFVRDRGLTESKAPIPLSVFILLPQFALMGITDTFLEVARIEFFYDQAPEGMKSLGTSYFTSSLGLGGLLSSVLLKTVAKVTRKGGHNGWIENNLNSSHLDYYYGLLVVLSVINLLFFIGISMSYVYNSDVVHTETDRAKESNYDANN